MTAEMTAEGLPVPPETIGGEPVTEGTPGEEERSRRKKALLLVLLGLLAMLVTIAIWYLLFRQPLPVPPIPIIPDSKLPAYVTSVYGAAKPMGIAVSSDGDRIYVAETDGDRALKVFDAVGNPVATVRPPESTGTEHVPLYVAIDPLTSEVYVSDRPTGTIYIYDRDGAYRRTLTLAKPIAGWQPVGIAFDSQGLLYVGDLRGPYPGVEVIDRQAQVVRTFGADQKLNFPNGITVDSVGNVYVADSSNGRLLVFDTSGKVRAQVGRGSGQGNLGLPRGVAVDNQGRVFVVDATGQGMFVYRAPTDESRRLDFIGFVGGEGVSDAQFEFPNGVAVDGRGRVYVADTINDRIQVWSY